ncbi:kinase-like domain-containing protein [Scleroderma yunnanense]
MNPILQDLSQRASRFSINLDGQIRRDRAYRPLCGGFADVYRGSMLSTGSQVAIKTPRAGLASDVDAIKRALREVHLWSKLKHDNILPLLGITTDFDYTVSIVSPWMQVGNAFSHVQDKEVDPRPLLEGIASGLSYLHTHDPQIFHGDLKGFNILVSTDGHALLADFGLSSLVDSSFSLSTNVLGGGTIRWMAPDVIGNYGVASAAGDVWAFGMTALELFTREVPFSTVASIPAVMFRIMQGPPDRPTPESTCFRLTEEWWQICLSCWNGNPSVRPPMSKILSVIEDVKSGAGVLETYDGFLTVQGTEVSEGNIILSSQLGSNSDDSKAMSSPDHHLDSSNMVSDLSESFSSFLASLRERTDVLTSSNPAYSNADNTNKGSSNSTPPLSMGIDQDLHSNGAITNNLGNGFTFASGGNKTLSSSTEIYV